MQELTIKQLFNIVKGKKVDQIESEQESSVRYLQIDDLRNDMNVKYCNREDKYVYATKEDIIIAWDGANAGTVGYNLEGAIGSTLAVLRKKQDNINTNYVAKFMQSKFKYLRDNCTGATIPHISRKVLEDLIVPLPSLDVQNHIVNVLDRAQSLIDKRKSQITALYDLTQSMFLEMFGDPIVNNKNFKIEKLSNLVIKLTDGTHHSPPMVDKGVPYISAKHLGSGELDFYKNPAYVSIEEHQKIYQRCNPVKGDVLYIKDGATTGIAAVNHYDFEFSMLSSLALIKCDNDTLNNTYLVYYLNNSRVKEKILNNMSGGAIKRLTLKKINDINIMVPPIKLQNEFSLKIKKVEDQKLLIKKSLLQLDNSFNSLVQRAFKGELFQD